MTPTRLGITSRRCSTSSLGKPIPTAAQHCAKRPVSTPWHCATYFCTTNVPSPRRGGRWNPRTGANAFSMATQDYTVTPAQRERSSPSLSTLCGHPRYYNATPGTVTTSPTLWKRTGTGRHHDHCCTSNGLSLTPPSSRPVDDGRTVNHYAITLEAAPVRA
jgi:hypothetical protein